VTQFSSYPIALVLSLLSIATAVRPASAQELPVDVLVQVLPVETLRLSDFDPTNPAAAPVVFTMTVTNDDKERDLVATLQVRGQRSGLVGTAIVELGVVLRYQVAVVTNRQFDSYDLADASSALVDFALERGVLPPDTYEFDVTLVDRNDNSIVGDGTAETTTTNSGAEIDLVAPGSPLDTQPDELTFRTPVFQWQADASSFDFEIFEVEPGQVSAEDIVTNLPVFKATDLQDRTLAYPGYAEELRPGHTYAWRVLSRVTGVDGIVRHPSELLWFAIAGSANDELLPGQPPPAASIEITPQEQTIALGESVTLSIEVFDINGELIRSPRIEWEVVPSTMGEVSAEGVFTAGSREGVAAIVARTSDIEDYATLTIEVPRGRELDSDSVYVFVDSPMNAHTFVEPSPLFSWHAVGADSVGQLSYTVALQQIGDDGAISQLWQRRLTAETLPYPADERALEQGSRYIVNISAQDSSGTVIATADPVEFALARNPKLSWDLYNVWDEAIRDGRDTSSVTILTLIRTPRLSTAIRDGIARIGGAIEIAEGPWVQMRIPFRSLEAIASLPDIRMMTVPAPHVLFNAAGDDLAAGHNTPLLSPDSSGFRIADDADYSPIDIAVFEFGFDRLKVGEAIDMNRLRFHTFRQDNRIEGSGSTDALHGAATVTALAEYLPPSATVHLINFDTEPEFQQALRYAVDVLGVKVVTCSVSWANAYDHYDGTSAFSRSIAEILGDKAALVVAAGNFAKSHWESAYIDADKDGGHDFNPDSSFLDLKLDSRQHYNFLLSWSDWGQPRMDLDLQILGPNGEPLYDSYGREYASRNVQKNAQFVEPIERIRSFSPIYPGTSDYRVRVTSNSQTREKDLINFELYVYPPPAGSSPAPEARSSLASGLATTNSDGVVPVAAAGFTHSSQGPTNDGRVRPDFATNGAVQIGNSRFEGTSFATPRVAAVLGDVLARNPSWSIQQAIAYLRSYSLLPETDDKNNVLGWGTINIEGVLGSQ